EDGPGPGHPAGQAQIGAREEPVALAPVEGDGQYLALAGEAGELHQEVHVPGLSPHLPVGDPLESGVLLELHSLANGGVLGGGKLGRVRLARFLLETQRLEGGGTEQASHVIGTERRSRLSHGEPPRRRGRGRAVRRYWEWARRPARRSPSPR